MELMDNLKSQLMPLYENLKEACKANENLVPFIMEWGEDFVENPEIIFYGRSTNGWDGSWNLEEVFNEFFNAEDQLKWAADSFNSYAFWRIVKGVTEKIYQGDWYKKVAFNNVCKAVPYKEGNPTDSVYYQTLAANQQIMEAEIGFWKPKIAVLLTGGNWSGPDWSTDFLTYLNGSTMPQEIEFYSWDDSYEDRKAKVYKIKDTTYIVTMRPETRDEQKHIDGLVALIQKYK